MNNTLREALRNIGVICDAGVLIRHETDKPTWHVLDAIGTLVRDAITQSEAETKRETERYAHAKQQGIAQAAGIAELVAALECDYGRLTELRDEKEARQSDITDAEGDDIETANDAMIEWQTANAVELSELEAAAGDFTDRDDAYQRIQEDPLEVQVRSDWHTPGSADDDAKPIDFMILLCTGGPACRIRGELDEHGTPTRAWIEFQDWGTSWMELHGEGAPEQDTLLTYCQQFYFGE